jgi:hypothetical protein
LMLPDGHIGTTGSIASLASDAATPKNHISTVSLEL